MAPSKKYCCVPQCNSELKAHIPGLSMHSFPKDNNLRKEWQRVLKIGKDISNYMVVCSLHFLKTDYFFPDLPVVRRKLKLGTCPSQCLPISTHEKKLSDDMKRKISARKKRAEKRHIHFESDGDKETEAMTECIDDGHNEILSGSENEFGCDEPVEEIVESKEVAVQVNTYLAQSFSIMNSIKSEKDLNRMTGIGNFHLFHAIVESMTLLINFKTQLPVEGLALLVLMKMKLNLSYGVLSVMFNISDTSGRRYFKQSVFILADVLKCVIKWPSKDETVKNMPQCFKGFEKTVVVLDCTEMPIEKPKCLKCRILSYSHYKGNHTVKLLVGVSPAGLIIFLSTAYGGRASDKFITLQSKVLDNLTPYIDACMVDKGFRIENECLEKGIEIYIPPFLKKAKQFTECKSLENLKIAKARVHVERAIQRLKLFSIFNEKMDWEMTSFINPLIVIAAGIVNLSSPILDELRF